MRGGADTKRLKLIINISLNLKGKSTKCKKGIGIAPLFSAYNMTLQCTF